LIDNIDLESDAGWDSFLRSVRQSPELDRPPYRGTFATCAGFTIYARRAGFEPVDCHRRPSLLILLAIEPGRRGPLVILSPPDGAGGDES
jgi:hypothetical protein